MSCSFDTDFCDWTQSVSDSLDWKRHRGPTSSPNTGPSYDHTTGGRDCSLHLALLRNDVVSRKGIQEQAGRAFGSNTESRPLGADPEPTEVKEKTPIKINKPWITRG